MQEYNWDAEDYENYSKSQKIWGEELLSKLNLNSNEHVLDIGCGDGKVIGIDSSEDFKFPYSFYSPEEYNKWITQTEFNKSRVELIPKYMTHNGQSELEGWIRTTWLPYLKTIPKDLRNKFISEIAERYIKAIPEDKRGIIQVKMIRLEVELIKPLK